ncbi:MAG: hypothetical protein Q9216_006687 [Gyalolechia sp. 2 TL-2023]
MFQRRTIWTYTPIRHYLLRQILLAMPVAKGRFGVINFPHVTVAKPPISHAAPPREHKGGGHGSARTLAAEKPTSAVPSPRDSHATGRQKVIVDSDVSFQGDSSFIVHSKQATQAFEASLASTPETRVDEALSDAMLNLQKALDSTNAQSSSPPRPSQSDSGDENEPLAALPIPPSDLVLKLLKHAKARPHDFLGEFPALDITALTTYCQKVFFATEPYSIATFIIVNISLIWLLRGLCSPASPEIHIDSSDLARYLAFLPENVEIAIQKLPLMITPSTENISALFLACSLAVESSIRASAWDLLSTAARLALNAGYHRLVKKSGDREQRQKRVIFWLIYVMDRALALNLGRAPNIQEYDIQTDRLSYPADMDGPMGFFHVCWIDVSELQGQIYLQLYSAHAQTQSMELRVRIAKQLATRCLEIRSTMQLPQKGTIPVVREVHETFQAQEIIFQSLLTMIYRVIPPANSSHPLQFGDDCIHSARTALTLHNKAWSEIAGLENDDWRIFIHWSTLFSPFVPFISVFGNVIAQSNSQDLALLGAFVSTLQSAAGQSRAVKKLYHACKSFHQIAEAYTANRTGHVTLLKDRDKNVLADCQTMDRTGELDFQPLSESFVSQQDWDFMLRDWDLGLGMEDARQMSTFLDLFPNA